MSYLDDTRAERRYGWWTRGCCPACGCRFYRKELGKAIGEDVAVCECCHPRISDADVKRVLSELVRGAELAVDQKIAHLAAQRDARGGN